jgi:hypothetical protein
MAEFHDRLKVISERNKMVKRKEGQVWPIEKRIEVVSQFLVLGNLKLVAATTGVDYALVRKWKGQPWWPELVAEIRASQNIEMDTTLSDLVQKSLEAVHDRLVNGDFFYDQKTGQVARRPVPLRDVHRVAVDLLAKREVLRDKSDNQGDHSQTSVEEHLKILAGQMSKWFEEKKKPVIELEEVEDAIYEERETGLQTGASVGTHEEAGPGEGTSGEERSPEDDGGQGTGEER